MILFPNCKINFGLHITRKREDGFHELETVFYPLPLRDVVEVVKAGAGGRKSEAGSRKYEVGSIKYENVDTDVAFTIAGLTVDGNIEDNLCLKAYRLLQKDFPQLPAIEMYLYKAIPTGAGLGGGSADGAFTLQLLNEKFQLGISQQKLLWYSLQLGSDCPFFIINKPCLATGRGEVLETIDLDLSAYSFMLVHPGIHINTSWAFSQLTPAPPVKSIRDMIKLPVENWKENLENDFEKPVCEKHPELNDIKEKLYHSGAIYASMTGSGSSFFGLFKKKQHSKIQWPTGYKVFSF